jgi:putative ABC transport system permease protein
LGTTILLALRAIRRNLMRSLLTVLGIVIGVAAVITMVTLGNGATQSVRSQIAGMGSNLLIVMPGQMRGPGSGSAANFKTSDAQAIGTQIGSLQAVAPTVTRRVSAIYGARNWKTSVTGTTNDYFTAGNWTLGAGRTFTDGELGSGKAVCAIGATVRAKMFGNEDPLGEQLRVGTFSCEVIAVLGAKGQSAMGTDQDDVVLMPLRTVQRRVTGTQDVGSIQISVKEGRSIDSARQQVSSLMRERRHLAAGQEDDFTVLDTRQIAETLTSTTRIMTSLLGAVAAVSLLVGGIGIMNIMLVSVTERTREIGIRLAIGAMEHEVLIQFLVEAVVLAALGGLLGVLIAAAASFGLAKLMAIPFVFQPGINLIAFLVAAATGIVFGYVPARRAARLDPIEALRHE